MRASERGVRHILLGNVPFEGDALVMQVDEMRVCHRPVLLGQIQFEESAVNDCKNTTGSQKSVYPMKSV